MRYVWAVLTSLAVLAGLSVPFFLGEKESTATVKDPEPVLVESEHMYYVKLSALEVTPRAEKDAKWDADGSPPDIYYEVYWQGERVFVSKTKKDTLVARWTNLTVGVGDVLGSGVSLDDSMKAARITARPGDEVEFRVYDKDVAKDDLVGRFKVPVERLRVGDQEWRKPAGRIVSAHGRVLVAGGQVPFDAVTR